MAKHPAAKRPAERNVPRRSAAWGSPPSSMRTAKTPTMDAITPSARTANT